MLGSEVDLGKMCKLVCHMYNGVAWWSYVLSFCYVRDTCIKELTIFCNHSYTNNTQSLSHKEEVERVIENTGSSGSNRSLREGSGYNGRAAQLCEYDWTLVVS